MPLIAIVLLIMGGVACLFGAALGRSDPPPRRPSISTPHRRPSPRPLPRPGVLPVAFFSSPGVRRA